MIACLRPCLGLCLFAAFATAPPPALAGALYRCEDGQGASIYQTLPCAVGQRTVERREYEEAALPATRPVREAGTGASPRSTSAPVQPSRARASSQGRPASDAFAHECRLGGERWVQAGPCAPIPGEPRQGEASARPARAPGQRAIQREEACRRVRDARHERAPGERSADSVYRRNLLRDRGGC